MADKKKWTKKVKAKADDMKKAVDEKAKARREAMYDNPRSVKARENG